MTRNVPKTCKKLVGFVTLLFMWFLIAEGHGFLVEPMSSTGDHKINIEKIKQLETPTPPASATPVPVIVQATTTSPAPPPLQHTSPVKPDVVQAATVVPGSSPTPEDPAAKKAREDAVGSYYAAVQKSNEALLAEYDHNKWTLKNREDVLSYQQWAGKVIFGVVLVLVFAGVAFSGVQFFIGIKQMRRRRHIEEDGVTTIEASWKGIKMTSSILGVIILMISFLFFYAYLIAVFQITVISE